ncbi:unnamed protein product, partial [Amoebophrya sp. A25]
RVNGRPGVRDGQRAAYHIATYAVPPGITGLLTSRHSSRFGKLPAPCWSWSSISVGSLGEQDSS